MRSDRGQFEELHHVLRSEVAYADALERSMVVHLLEGAVATLPRPVFVQQGRRRRPRPTPFTSMRPLLVVELDSPHKTEASYTSRKQLFSGETGSLDPRVEDPNEDEDKAVADERGEAYNMSPNLTQLSDELSRVNFKSTAAQYKAPGTNESYESALDDGVITRKMEILLDLSYLRAGVKLPKFAITNAHRKRIMLILDNSTRAKLVIAMILRNNKDIELWI